MKTYLLIFFLILTGLPALATVELPSIIGSNMVIQCDEPVSFWGWADIGEKITIKQAGKTIATTEGQGKETPWHVKLPAQKAGPVADIEIVGSNTITLTNLLAGEVWLFSGQSNMVQTLGNGPWCVWGGVPDGEKVIAESTDDQIRFFVEESKASPQPQSRPVGSWRVLSPETAPYISAVACFFVKQIRSELKIPAGAIVSAVGATPAEAWTPARDYFSDPQLAEVKNKVTAVKAEVVPQMKEDWKAIAAWKQQVDEAKAKGTQPPPQPPSAVPADKAALIRILSPITAPGGLYNGKIHPLAPFNIRGAVWYQGENNAPRGEYYAATMKRLISGWREDWDKPFPFVMVALAGWGPALPWNDKQDGSFATVREAQIKVADLLPDCGVISAVDVGNQGSIHPRDKRPVGQRAALWALQRVYAKNIRGTGPVIKKVDFASGKAVVTIGGDRDGLMLKTPGGFELAGEDRNFVTAKAEIKGEAVEVSAPGVEKPVALRYAFLNFPECTLYNSAGLPALPFRTDDWPIRPSAQPQNTQQTNTP